MELFLIFHQNGSVSKYVKRDLYTLKEIHSLEKRHTLKRNLYTLKKVYIHEKRDTLKKHLNTRKEIEKRKEKKNLDKSPESIDFGMTILI